MAFECDVIVAGLSNSQPADSLRFFHITISRCYRERSEKISVSSSSLRESALMMSLMMSLPKTTVGVTCSL